MIKLTDITNKTVKEHRRGLQHWFNRSSKSLDIVSQYSPPPTKIYYKTSNEYDRINHDEEVLLLLEMKSQPPGNM